MADTKLTPEIRAVLEAAHIKGNNVTLVGQLDRKLYIKVNAFLEAAGGTWSRKEKCHVFNGDPKTALGLVVAEGVVIDIKKKFQAFYTPPELATRLAEYANVDGYEVLEPSCGGGALMLAALQLGASYVLGLDVQDVTPAQQLLQKEGYAGRIELVQADFLLTGTEPYPRILMNPPFAKRQDEVHVRKAFHHHLAPSGRLVAVMSPRGAQAIKRELESVAKLIQVEDVASGAFKESGTGVCTSIIVISKRP